jgi:hypothetical protein
MKHMKRTVAKSTRHSKNKQLDNATLEEHLQAVNLPAKGKQGTDEDEDEATWQEPVIPFRQLELLNHLVCRTLTKPIGNTSFSSLP